MSAVVERTVGDLTVRVDRTLCVGFGDCVQEAPEAFRLDEEEVVVFESPEQVGCERLLRACEVCPVDAISVFDAGGKQLVP